MGDLDANAPAADDAARVAELTEQCDLLEAEMQQLRRRLQDGPKRVRTLEERLLETKGQLAQAVSQNEKLTFTLRESRDHIGALREEVDKLTQPPSAYGTLLAVNDDETVDVVSGGRKMRVAVAPGAAETLEPGMEVVLNDSLNVVQARSPEHIGEVVTFSERIGTDRALVKGRADEERVVQLAPELQNTPIRAGDTLRMDARSGMVLEKLPRPEVEELVLEEVPDITYSDVGGLDEQIEQIADAVELPYVHAELFAEHRLPAPKGILLYGPPGCGKTLIAKAVANSLARKVGTSEKPSARSAWCSNAPAKSPRKAGRSSCSSMRWIRCSGHEAPGSHRTWNPPSCRNSSPRSTGSRPSRT